jgi:hypothetical protein
VPLTGRRLAREIVEPAREADEADPGRRRDQARRTEAPVVWDAIRRVLDRPMPTSGEPRTCHQFVRESPENRLIRHSTAWYRPERRIVETRSNTGQTGIPQHGPARPDGEFKSPLRHELWWRHHTEGQSSEARHSGGPARSVDVPRRAECASWCTTRRSQGLMSAGPG